MSFTDVAIAIVEQDGKLLICRRRSAGSFGGYWEFPGGKCAPAERPADCVRREVTEEVGLTVEPVHAFGAIEHAYDSGAIRLHPFLCRVVAGRAEALASDEVRWVEPAQLFEHAFPPANDPLLAAIVQHLRPSGAGA